MWTQPLHGNVLLMYWSAMLYSTAPTWHRFLSVLSAHTPSSTFLSLPPVHRMLLSSVRCSPGQRGYILKDSQENLLTSIRLLRGGGSPVSPTVARSVLRAIHARTITQSVPPKRDSAPPTSPVGRPVHQHADDGRVLLSQRESEIIMLLAKGISFSEIGGILGISPHTVTAHIKKIYKKLGVHRAAKRSMKPPAWGLCRFNAAMLQRSRAATVAQQHVIPPPVKTAANGLTCRHLFLKDRSLSLPCRGQRP